MFIKRNLYIVALLISGVLLSSCYMKQDKPVEEKKYITVQGTGAVTLKPDMVSLKFHVKTTDWNVNKAAEKNAVKTTNVLNSLKELGIADEDVSTYDYRISQDNSKEYPGQYTVQNIIVVNVRNVDNVGNVIDAAVKNNTGANGISSFKYLVTDKTTALRQARTLAVQNAQDAASLLAGASGCKIGDVVDLREDYTSSDSYGNDRMYKAVAMESDSNVATPIAEGNVTVTSNITVKYELTK